MNKTTSIIRIASLILLAMTAAVCIFSEPLESSATWLSDFLLSKATGLAAALVLVRLYSAWSKTDPLLRRYHRRISEIY